MTRIQKLALYPTGQFLRLCRVVYCWLFAILLCCTVEPLVSTIHDATHKPAIDKADAAAIVVIAAYTAIFGIAWWTVFQRRRTSRWWGIAASFVIAVPDFPYLLVGGWRIFWESHRSLLPFMPFGVLGIIAFSVPYSQEKLPQLSDTPETARQLGLLHQPAMQLALKIGRNLYGWVFFAYTCYSGYGLAIDVLISVVKHSAILLTLAVGIPYSAVFGIAWWTIFRGKPAAQRWAIAANCVLILPHLVLLSAADWRVLWWFRHSALYSFVAFFGLLGILLFSLPSSDLRAEPQIAVS